MKKKMPEEMKTTHQTDSDSTTTSYLLSQPSLRIQEASLKLAEGQVKIASVRDLVERSIHPHQDDADQALCDAITNAEECLSIAERWLVRLQDAKEDSWYESKAGFDNAWEDFSRTLQKIVLRL